MHSKIICNKCGKIVKYKNGVLMEDFCEVTKDWGFFSKKDLETHIFNLCEDCYDDFIGGFVVPVKKVVKSEAL